MITIQEEDFNKIVTREQTKKDELPEYTLDWYIYSNRVSLLEEVKKLALVEPVKVISDKKGYFPE